MTPRFIYFDLGNVLVTFDHWIACRQMAELASVTAERVWEIVFESGLEWDYERGDISGDAFYERFCQACGTRPDYDRLLRAACDIFQFNGPVGAIVSHLKRDGHRLGILSNTNQAHWEFISSGQFERIPADFEVHALSYQIRSMKPEAKIYEIASELAGVAPQEIFFVDDNRDNVAGARQMGFDAVPYTTVEALVADLENRGVRVAL